LGGTIPSSGEKKNKSEVRGKGIGPKTENERAPFRIKRT